MADHVPQSLEDLSIVKAETLAQFIARAEEICPPLTHGLACMLYPQAQAASELGFVHSGGCDLLCFCISGTGFAVICSSEHVHEAQLELVLLELLAQLSPKFLFATQALINLLKAGQRYAVEDHLSCIALRAPPPAVAAAVVCSGLDDGVRFEIAVDAPQLAEFVREFNAELGLSFVDVDKTVAELIQKQAAFFLCDPGCGDEPVCLCCAQGDCQVSDSVRLSRITTLYTFPKFRGKGYGKVLLKLVQDHIRSTRNGSEIRLYVDAHNAKTRRFYAGAGFTEQQGGLICQFVKMQTAL
eukprot:CAMPEP_0171087944 /NCGR_PEP_ID=MMETSP0766_2-20121228/20466_1 /TAXON_ID=439317 /ORGANISM="Gambierdiscus australes, Strain CAWD 149" /LENGTH=297 /DNA_ID=CAMNT_0011545683 /DNA_START=44 /DNA_END=937 /DNA_ORIENTATION=+